MHGVESNYSAAHFPILLCNMVIACLSSRFSLAKWWSTRTLNLFRIVASTLPALPAGTHIQPPGTSTAMAEAVDLATMSLAALCVRKSLPFVFYRVCTHTI